MVETKGVFTKLPFIGVSKKLVHDEAITPHHVFPILIYLLESE